ncbi:MAG: hypothetical protein NUV46_03275 [Nanoarchaeota archaeon]|nr:hypothetical protein [Nanoarchaeota archaeon]
MEKNFRFTENEYYGRVVPYLQEITDAHDIGEDEALYSLNSEIQIFELKTPYESLEIIRIKGFENVKPKFNVRLNTDDFELMNNLEKISKGNCVKKK